MSRSRPIALTILVLVLSACSTTRTLQLSPTPDPEVVEYVNGHPEWHFFGWVETQDTAVQVAELEIVDSRLLVLPLGDSFIERAEERLEYDLSQVVEIGMLNRRRGFFESILGAVGVAAGIGAIGSLFTDTDDPNGRTRLEQGLFVGAVASVFTVPVGFVVGASGAAHVVRIQVVPGS